MRIVRPLFHGLSGFSPGLMSMICWSLSPILALYALSCPLTNTRLFASLPLAFSFVPMVYLSGKDRHVCLVERQSDTTRKPWNSPPYLLSSSGTGLRSFISSCLFELSRQGKSEHSL